MSQWFANYQESPQDCPRIISEWFTNHWELPQNHFTVVCKSPRITKNHQESPQNHFRVVHKPPRITPRIISEWFVNHLELPQNHFRVVNESARIIENHPRIISEWFANHRESLRIIKNLKNHWESHKNNKAYFFNGPQPNDTYALRSLYLQWFLLILIDSANPDHFPTRSKPSHRCPCRQQLYSCSTFASVSKSVPPNRNWSN